MIFYDKNLDQIAFILDESVSSALTNWNQELQLSPQSIDRLQNDGSLVPTFRIDLFKTTTEEMEIELTQLFPPDASGKKFQQIFPAQHNLGILSFMTLNPTSPVFNLQSKKMQRPNYGQLFILQISLREYPYLLGWRHWKWIDIEAFSGRYSYEFHFGTGYIDSTVYDNFTGEKIDLDSSGESYITAWGE
jgi:hypothetical protein